MKSTTLKLLLVAGTVFTAAEARAGAREHHEVVFVFVGGDTIASGSLVDVRNSADSVQYIGCEVSVGTGSSVVHCSAKDAAGFSASCHTQNALLVAAASSIKGDSLISIGFGTYTVPEGSCTYISVRNSSLDSSP